MALTNKNKTKHTLMLMYNLSLPTADYVDQMCSVSQELEDTISHDGGVEEDKVNWYLPVSD